jgi:hypothetical protein
MRMDAAVAQACEIFEASMAWFTDTYDEQPFFLERDIVYTLQRHLWELLRDRNLDWSVFNDYPMIPGRRRSLSADLAVRSARGQILLVAEFKYEPAHSRKDILSHKLPVIGWADALHDVTRIQRFVDEKRAPAAYAILVDEGGFFRRRDVEVGSEWRDREVRTPEGYRVSIMWTRYPR